MNKLERLALEADRLNYEEEHGRCGEADRQEADRQFYAALETACVGEIAKACRNKSGWHAFWHLMSMEAELERRLSRA